MVELQSPGFMAKLFRLDGKVALMTGGHGALAEAMGAALADLGRPVIGQISPAEELDTVLADLAQLNTGSNDAKL